MAETWEDYGDYSAEEIYQSKSPLGKFFSWRNIKKFLKFLMIVLVLLVYGLLFFRMCTGKPPKALNGVLWTEPVYKAYETHGENLRIYEQEPVKNTAKDGYFGIYDVIYIPEAETVQMTVRFNNSSIKALRSSLAEKEEKARKDAIKAAHPDYTKEEIDAALAKDLEENPIEISLAKNPFVFILRDNYGNVYTDYSYLHEEKTVYQYMRISYTGVPLFGHDMEMGHDNHPTPEADNPAFLHKGANAATGDSVTYLYMDMYYENDVDVYGESFAFPLQVFTNTVEITKSSLGKDLPTAPDTDLPYVSVPRERHEN